MSLEEALELATAKVAFPRVSQRAWPNARSDSKPGNQYHFTELLFDVQVDSSTNFARIYHIMIHFGKPIKEYFNSEIKYMTNTRFQKIGIHLGDILEPIAPLCSTKDPGAWNGMINP
jgi:hypothetical protein